MVDDSRVRDPAKGQSNAKDYQKHLQHFDAAVCEAIAVSQACARRLETPTVCYSTRVFVRICTHAQAMMCAAPKSRWVKREFDIWDVSTVASHARSILEGYLLFRYLADAPDNLNTQLAYEEVIHLYDCMKRIKILPHLLPVEEITSFQEQAKEITTRLEGNTYFSSLDPKLQKELLAGKWMTITPKNDLIANLEIDQAEFDFFWHYLSQYTHVLSFSFHRMEPNGRGTGLENDFDRAALCMVMEFCSGLLIAAVDRLVEPRFSSWPNVEIK